jgi:hypothetical protein
MPIDDAAKPSIGHNGGPALNDPKVLVVPVWPDAGRALGLGRNATYEAVARGEIPVIRFGRRIVVPKAKLFEMVGVG